MKRFILATTAVVSMSTVSCTTAFAAGAQPSGAIYMQPIGRNVFDNYFMINSSKGKTETVSLRLSNESNKYNATEQLYVSDALASNGGGMAAANPDQVTTKGVGGWFAQRDRKQTISLAPSQTKTVSLTLTVPKNVTSGDHLGEIVLYRYQAGKQQQAGKNKTSLTVNHAYEQAVAVVVKTPGPVHHHISLLSLQPAWNGQHLFFNLKMRNDGNQIEKSTAGTLVFSEKGKVIYTQKSKMGSLYPDTSTVYSFEAPAVLRKAGNYTVQASWHYNGSTVEKAFPYSIQGTDVTKANKRKLANEGKDVTNQSVPSSTKYVYTVIGVLVFILVVACLFLLFMRKPMKNRRKGRHVKGRHGKNR